MIAEHADLPTVLHMMQTCSEMNALVTTYERSVSQRMASLRTDAGVFLPTSTGSILSSFDHERLLIKPTTMDYVQELDMRARRVDDLFVPESPLHETLVRDRSYTALPVNQMAKLISGLKRAALIANRLSDILADMTTMTLQAKTIAKDVKVDRTNQIIRRAHIAQLKYIGALPPLDLAYLGTLTDVASNAFATSQSHVESDPDPWARVSAFKEAFLRQGSMVLWAWMAPSPSATGTSPSQTTVPTATVTMSTDPTPKPTTPTPTQIQKRLATYASDVIGFIIEEIDHYERGKAASTEEEWGDQSLILPGLYPTVHDTFAKTTGWAFERAGKEMELMVLMDIRQGS